MKPTIQRTLKFNNRLLPVLVTLLLFMQLAFPYRGWMMLLISLSGLWLTGYVWSRALLQNLHVKRQMRFGWAHVGDRLEEQFTLINTGLIPAIWVEVVDETTMPDYDASRVTGVDGHSQNRWQTQGVCSRRGIFTLGPTTLLAGDPFGLYTITIHLPDASVLTVTPPIVPLPTIEVAPGGRAGEGRSRPNLFEQTVSSAGVRQYVAGDGLNLIHWPTTARLGSLFVRQLDSTPASHWWIFLDLEGRVQTGQGFASTEEHGIILAASLADRGLRRGQAVGFATYGQDLYWHPADNGRGQHQRIMRTLAQVSPGQCSLANLLAHSHLSARQAASLIIITANSSGDWIEALLPLLRRGLVPTILLLDPVSFGGKRSTASIEAVLSQLNVVYYVITQDLLDRPEARPGQQGQWEWHLSPSGRAIATNQPKDMSWKQLG